MLRLLYQRPVFSFFFFTHATTAEIYTLSLHDALPIFLAAFGLQDLRLHLALGLQDRRLPQALGLQNLGALLALGRGDRKSTRLNSSHSQTSYADFCLKKKTVISSLLYSRVRSGA